VSEASAIRVAIVDDDPSYGRAVARLLRASRMETRTFTSAEAYLAAESETSADCLVLDIQLGGMSGFELQRRLVSTASRTAVVFLSAHDEARVVARVAGTGCLLVRKSDPSEFVLEAIRRALEGVALPHEAVADVPGDPHPER
jgi:FixJ family two-component response regulator